MYPLIHLFFAASDLPAPIVAYLNMRQRAAMLVESVGLFWIGAELAILFLVLVGRRHVDSVPLPVRFVLTVTELRRAIFWGVAFAILSAIVLGRYAVSQEIDIQGLSERLHTHLVVWAAFVTTWVLLETSIVYHGWRGYRRLRVLVEGPMWRGKTLSSAILFLLCLLGAGLLASWHASAVDTDAFRQAIRDANEADQVYWNALYLYLRLAGAVWIAVEWWAAIVLVKGYRLLERATALRRGAP
ncbi:MAG: hypothetical protein NTU83_05000 [Candidatus Hydrogenedentes bacterium]|nr:hypothetical protein [Candidatus Hydrogenedentota bacterium]